MFLNQLISRTQIIGLFIFGIGAGVCVPGQAETETVEAKWSCQPDASSQKWSCNKSSEVFSTNTLEPESIISEPVSSEPVVSEPINNETSYKKDTDTESQHIGVTSTDTSSSETPSTESKSATQKDSVAQPANIEKATIPGAGFQTHCEAGMQSSMLADLTDFIPTPPGKTRISADQSDGDLNYFVLTGNVDIVRENQRLMADKVIYDKKNNRVDAFDNVNFLLPNIQISGSKGHTQIEGEQASFEDAQYEMMARNARGTASLIQRESKDIMRMTKLSYSTCPDERQDWVLKASKLKLDNKEGVGTARNAVIRFKNIPIFYTPYIRFPIDDRRKSGFLLPSIGTSDESGTAVEIPYYWNISPNRDATIKPKNLTDRGVLLGGEYRYLHSKSSGKLEFEYLPDDEIFKDDRHQFSYKHQSRFGQYWRTDVLLNNVSDDDYFINLGDNLSQSSTTHLERHIDLTYTRPTWSVLTRFQNFQPVGSSESYRRLPQIKLNTNIPEKKNGLQYHLDTEFVRFDHKEAVTTGSRLDVMPGISLNYSNIAYFITPKISLRHTRYSLDLPAIGNPDDPNRTTPIFSLDSGIFFERESTFRGWNYLQTLEPRIYYLYVPFRDQSSLPVFDTGALTNSLAQLFRENRFNGPDRQGDANQITTAVTTRFIENDSGRERLSATIGQLYYLDDRRVNLPGNNTTTFSRSDIFAEISIYPWEHTSLSTSIQRDTRLHQISKTSTQIQYQKDARHILNASYRYQDNSTNQATISAIWPISQRWSTVAHWEYSFKDDGNTLEGIAGIQYDTCCWNARFVYRNYFLGTRDNNALFLQLSLKGLAKIGEGIGSLLEEKISGYADIDSVQ